MVLTLKNQGELNSKLVLGDKELSGMISLLESEITQVNQLQRDQESWKARSNRVGKSPD